MDTQEHVCKMTQLIKKHVQEYSGLSHSHTQENNFTVINNNHSRQLCANGKEENR